MVGFNPNAKDELTYCQHAISGALSGVVTRGMCQPLDVIKIRFQIEPIKNTIGGGKYKGIIHSMHTIWKEEGVTSLWKGHVPAQMLSIVYGVVQFVTFEALTRTAWHQLSEDITSNWKPVLHFGCGSIAGCVATFASFPLDVIRTRLISQGEPKTYRGVSHGVLSIIQKESPFVLYRGLLPTFLQIAPYSGLQFGFYTLLQTIWQKLFLFEKTNDIGWMESIVCGSLAGTGAKAAVYPLDLMKKRLQVQGFQHARRNLGKGEVYKGLIDCILKITAQEGVFSLYKGFAPSLMKAALSTGFSFCFYEQICRILRLTL